MNMQIIKEQMSSFIFRCPVSIYLNTWLAVKGVQYFACRMTESLEYMNLSSQKKLEQKEQEVLELKVNVLEERFKGMLKSLAGCS